MNKSEIIQSIDAEIENLKQARQLLDGHDGPFPMSAISGVGAGNGRRRRHMSAAARARISAAQKARWAKVKAGKKK